MKLHKLLLTKAPDWVVCGEIKLLYANNRLLEAFEYKSLNVMALTKLEKFVLKRAFAELRKTRERARLKEWALKYAMTGKEPTEGGLGYDDMVDANVYTTTIGNLPYARVNPYQNTAQNLVNLDPHYYAAQRQKVEAQPEAETQKKMWEQEQIAKVRKFYEEEKQNNV